ncbi:GntR family transcriptional regulator, trehalose operon transcriptional repressor [Clostridium uliginosum]|uniref:Trehalose operon repressor n=1 Tax=Clostridium uliginosum TaxID=119641 RepID=A0A1I1K647_9CLOT|nr:GntR family transcriptional regulator, trehalose operon transcriptional repressor [Clostridium uliginosum]
MNVDSKYLIIYNSILNKIENENLKPYDKLPSESALMGEYKVSRDTVRKSLNLLEQNGYIQKSKGKVAFVLDINKVAFPISGITSFKEIAKKANWKYETHVEELDIVKNNKRLMNKLKISEEDEVWRLIRVREIDDERVILDKDYLNREFVPELTEQICKESIYDYIEKELGLKISFAKKEITVQNINDEDKNYLDIKNYDMIVVVKSYVYLEDATLFQYTESRHRPDKFRFVDFARRNY